MDPLGRAPVFGSAPGEERPRQQEWLRTVKRDFDPKSGAGGRKHEGGRRAPMTIADPAAPDPIRAQIDGEAGLDEPHLDEWYAPTLPKPWPRPDYIIRSPPLTIRLALRSSPRRSRERGTVHSWRSMPQADNGPRLLQGLAASLQGASRSARGAWAVQ